MTSEHWERIAALFDEARDLEVDEREDYLSALADDDLEAELRSLLSAHERRGRFDELREFVTGPDSEQLTHLQPGDEIGPYRVIREIAAGGMATVYLAQDIKHDRQVAVKVLGPVLAAVLGAERFAQEIMTTARLQHPHILPLLDSGQAAGQPYYVMPYIEGETLREKLNRETQLGVEEAVRIATEVADALDYAHRNELVHRDIKPENILLHDGRPLVGDFGIALAVSAAAAGRTTEAGLLLGTPHYMSPEQATAEDELTSRSDIYSLGCVLYEMLAGEPPITGTSTQDIIRRIVTDEPRPISELRKSVPHNVAAATAKSLEKLPADRFSSARNFARALDDPDFTTPVTRVDPRFGRRPAQRSRLAAWLAALAAVASVAAAWGWLRDTGRGASSPVVEFTLDPPARGMYFGEELALSPDGHRLVVEVLTADGWVLYERRRDSRDWRVIRDTESARSPFFSPDGRWLGYFSGRERAIKKIPVAGGAARTITQAAWLGGASWGPGDTIVFQTKEDPSTASPPQLYLVSASGGVPEPLMAADSALPPIHGSPEWLPGGDVLLFKSGMPPFVSALAIESGSAVRLTPGMSPDSDRRDRMAYVTADGSLMLQAFDANTLTLQGEPRSIAEGISIRTGGDALVTLAEDGSLAYLAASERETSLVLVDRKGESRVLFTPGIGSSMGAPRFSPDGSRIAFVHDQDIWVYSVTQGTARRLSFEDGHAGDPAWTNDGRSVGYSVRREAGDSVPAGIWLRAADGMGDAVEIVDADTDLWELDFGPGDDEVVVFSVDNIHRVSLSDRTRLEPLIDTESFVAHGTLSPNGRWIAYRSNESGVNEVYIRSYPGMGPATVVSTGGGSAPAWSADGSQIFYWGKGHMNAAAIRIDGDAVTVQDRTRLFHAGPFQEEWNRNYDVHPNGREFVLVSRPNTRIVWRASALAGVP